MRDILFEMKNICKEFPGVKALDDVSFDVAAGEVHVLVGENGAGKSTLMKVLSGLYTQEKGSILYLGKPIEHNSTRKTQQLGISTIYQELNLCDNLNVSENISLGKEFINSKTRLIDENAAIKESEIYLAMLDSTISPLSKVSTLSIAEKQMVEIARALSFNSRVIIMDEPTSSLTLRETDKLLSIIKKLRDEGKAIIYISHRLEEIFQIADLVTVLRDGKLIGTKKLAELDYKKVVQMMVGREIAQKYIGSAYVHNDVDNTVLLEVKNISVKGVVDDISFKLHRGEILGFSGLVGAGRTELMEAIYGLGKLESGKIVVKEKEVKITNPNVALQEGIAMITEDRKGHGLFENFTMRENLTISNLKPLVSKGYVPIAKEKKYVMDLIDKLQIKPPFPEHMIATMSGGNQQKVIIARSLTTSPDILIMDEPSRGVDVGAREEIYKIMRLLAKENKGIICVSSDLPEILTLCDRIIVMNRGKIHGEFLNEEATEEKIMELSV